MQLNFVFSIEQTNLILASLGQRPYAEVSDMINAIHAQAQPQMKNAEEAAKTASEDESN